jgi:hypothetical protein
MMRSIHVLLKHEFMKIHENGFDTVFGHVFEDKIFFSREL